MNYYRSIKLKRMFLGDEYNVWWGTKFSKKGIKPPIVVRLIKVTPMGYNLLNLDTNKCILRRHLYPSKHYNNDGQNMSFLY